MNHSIKVKFLALLFLPARYFVLSCLMAGLVLGQENDQTGTQSHLSPRDQLKQYIADLQQNLGDQALREKIIKLVQTLHPTPAIPEEAENHSIRGDTAFQEAKSPEELADAIKEYSQALKMAPWVPKYYYNLGAIQEKAGQVVAAKGSYQNYLLAAPGAEDAADVHRKIVALEYKMEKSANEQAKYGYILGRWNSQTRFANLPVLTWPVDFEFTEPGKVVKGFWHFLNNTTEPKMRGTVQDDGSINWEFMNISPEQHIPACPEDIGYRPITLSWSQDKRSASFSFLVHDIHCDPRETKTAYETLTRE